MPPRKSPSSFILGPVTFRTKGEAADAVRDVANRAEFNVPLHGVEKELILELLDRHHEAARKIGAGIKDVVVRTNTYGQRGFYILRVDGSETDFSWTKCLTPPRAIDRVRNVLRSSVLAQKLERRDEYFRSRDIAPCELTGKTITAHACHIHHEEPTFADLVRGFLAERAIAPESVEFVRADGVEGATLEAAWAWLATEFAEYHRHHARLLVVHAHEHLSLPRGST